MAEPVRLQKYMADCGVGGRRRCEEWIDAGQVFVNGACVVEQGVKIDPDKDVVTFHGRVLKPITEKVTVMLNKPSGYVTTVHDQFNRPNVCELVKIQGIRLFPVGRLDYMTTGLLLLTNDGELAQKLTHPSFRVPRTYHAVVRGAVTGEALEALRKGGLPLEDGSLTSPAKVKHISSDEKISHVEVTIAEGRNREVRQMFAAVGYPVLRLSRTSYANLTLGGLQEGKYRRLTEEELSRLEQYLNKLKKQ